MQPRQLAVGSKITLTLTVQHSNMEPVEKISNFFTKF
jgi:hypothetical protein